MNTNLNKEFIEKYKNQDLFDLASDYISDNIDELKNLKKYEITDKDINKFLNNFNVELSNDDKNKLISILNKERESW